MLAASPLIAGMVRQLGTTAASQFTSAAQDTLAYSADLVAYVVPSPFHPWWGAWAADWLRLFQGTLIEKVMFPTYTALALAAAGWVLGRRRGWPVGGWAAMAGAFFLLSLGPFLHVDGQLTGLPLPAWLLYQLPVANLTRAPGRFVVMVIIALALLMAYGLAALVTGIRDQGSGIRDHARGRPALALLAVALLAFELWTAPYRLTGWNVPAATARLAALPAGHAVFDLPYSPYESAYMQAQIVHQHPILGGYLARAPAYPVFDGVPVITDLKQGQSRPDLCAPPLAGQGPNVFAALGTGALVLHKDRYDPRGLAAAEALAAETGLGAPVWEDDRLVIYEPSLPATLTPWANLEQSTWYDREPGPDGGLLRWMGAAARLHVWRPVATAATLELRVLSFHTTRRIGISVGGQELAPATVGPDPTTLRLALPPATGDTAITLQALDPPASPAGVGAGSDPRLLSIALVGCTLSVGP